MRKSVAASKLSASRAKTQFNFASGSGTAFASTSRAMIGIIRLLCETACASSFPQISEVTESGESTKTKVSAPSIAGKIACMNSSAGRMPCQSTQVSRPPALQRLVQPLDEFPVLARIGDEYVGPRSCI